jgi:hypothetical protein
MRLEDMVTNGKIERNVGQYFCQPNTVLSDALDHLFSRNTTTVSGVQDKKRSYIKTSETTLNFHSFNVFNVVLSRVKLRGARSDGDKEQGARTRRNHQRNSNDGTRTEQ